MEIFLTYYIEPLQEIRERCDADDVFYEQGGRPWITATEEDARALVQRQYLEDCEQDLELRDTDDGEREEFESDTPSTTEFYTDIDNLPPELVELKEVVDELFSPLTTKPVFVATRLHNCFNVCFRHEVGSDLNLAQEEKKS